MNLCTKSSRFSAWLFAALAFLIVVVNGAVARASEADLAIPRPARRAISTSPATISAWNLLLYGALVICGTLGISLYLRAADRHAAGPQVDARHRRDHLPDLQDLPDSAGQVPAHAVRAHRDRHDAITCSASATRGRRRQRALAARSAPVCTRLAFVLLFSIVGMGGSYAVAWYGIRVNTYANCPHRVRLAARRAVGRGQHSAAGRHVDRPVPDLARTGHDGHHPAVRAAADRRLSASSASPSANRSAPRPCASPAASSPRSPTSAPT